MSLFDVLMARRRELNNVNEGLAAVELKKADAINAYKEKATQDLEDNKNSIIGEYSRGGLLDSLVATGASLSTQLGNGVASAIEMHSDANETDPIAAAQTRLATKKFREALNMDSLVGINPETGERTTSIHRRVLGDTGLALVQGSALATQGLVGIGSMFSGGRAGQLAKEAGFRPKEGIAILDEYLSPEMRKANHAVEGADGFGNTVDEVLSNPGTIPYNIAKSGASMAAGGLIGKAMGIIKGVGTGLAGAIGEGTIMAGSQAEAIREETADGRLTLKQSLLAAATGVMGAGVGFAGNKLAKALNVGDIDEALVAGALAKSPRGMTTRTLLTAGIEGGEELLQSGGEQIAKNLALNKPYDEGVGNAAALGMMTGAPMGAAFGLGGSIADAGNNRVANIKEQKTREEDAKNNDYAKYTDPASPNFDPVKGVGVLSKHAQLPGTLPEVKAENLIKARETVQALEESIERKEDVLVRSMDPVAAKEMLGKLQTSLNSLDPTNVEGITATKQAMVRIEEGIALSADPSAIKHLKQDLVWSRQQLNTSREVQEQFAEKTRTKVSLDELDMHKRVANTNVVKTTGQDNMPGIEELQASVNALITSSMHGGKNVTPEFALELANNNKNVLTPEQRTYFRELSAARVAENALLKLGDVSQRVYTGWEEDVGIAQYQRTIAQSIEAKDERGVLRALGGLKRFAADHTEKAALASKHFHTSDKNKAQGGDRQILKVKGGGWEVLPYGIKHLLPEELKANGGFKIHPNSGEFVDNLQTEANALRQAVKEQEAAYALTFGKESSTKVATTATNAAGAAQAAAVVGGATQTNTAVTPPVVPAAPVTQTPVQRQEDDVVIKEATEVNTNQLAKASKQKHTKQGTGLDAEHNDAATLLNLLGVQVTTGSTTQAPSEHEVLTAQSRLLEMYKEVRDNPASFDSFKAEISKLVNWLVVPAGNTNTERLNRATKGAEKRGRGNANAHYLIQLAEEMGETLSEVMKLGTSQLDSVQLEVQKRALKHVRFWGETVNKDANSPYNGMTNKEALAQAKTNAQSKKSTPAPATGTKAASQPKEENNEKTIGLNIDDSEAVGDALDSLARNDTNGVGMYASIRASNYTADVKAYLISQADPFREMKFFKLAPEDKYQQTVDGWVKKFTKGAKVVVVRLPQEMLDRVQISTPAAHQYYEGVHYIVLSEGLPNANILSMLAHEFGHALQEIVFDRADENTQKSVISAWKKDVLASQKDSKKLSNFISAGRFTPDILTFWNANPSTTVKALVEAVGSANANDPDYLNYLTSFSEWFAENTSRYITNQVDSALDEEVQSFWKDLIATFKKFFDEVIQPLQPNTSLSKWLDSVNQSKGKADVKTPEAQQAGTQQSTKAAETVATEVDLIEAQNEERAAKQTSKTKTEEQDIDFDAVNLDAQEASNEDTEAAVSTTEKVLAVLREETKDSRIMRTLTALEQGMLSEVLASLKDSLGSALSGVVHFFVQEDKEGSTVQAPKGTFFRGHQAIAIHVGVFTSPRSDVYTGPEQRLLATTVHELAHSRDHGLSVATENNDGTEYESERFKALNPGGSLYLAVQAAMGKNAVLAKWFGPIFKDSLESFRIPRELYAQLYALYLTKPELMNEETGLAKAYQAIEENIAYHQALAAQRIADGRGVSEGSQEPSSKADGEAATAGTSSRHAEGLPRLTQDPKAPPPGALTALQQSKSLKDTLYRYRNLLADHFYQKAAGLTAASQRPLVMVKDFISSLGDTTSFEEFLTTNSYTASDKQKTALVFFQKKAGQWQKKIGQYLVKGDNGPSYQTKSEEEKKQFLFRNPLNWLMMQDASGKTILEENVTTAISYSAFGVLAELADAPKTNSKKTINALLGRHEDATLPPYVESLFSTVGTRATLVRNSAGKTVTAALGMHADKDAPQNVMVQLQGGFGTQVERLLVSLGLAVLDPISAEKMVVAMNLIDEIDAAEKAEEEAQAEDQGSTNEARRKNAKKINKHEEQFFLRVARDAEGNLTPQVQEIIEAMKGSNNILDKLMSVESHLTFPSLTPLENTQKATSTGQKIPGLLNKVNDQNRAQKSFARKDFWKLLQKGLHPDTVDALAGIVKVDNKTTHISERIGLKAKNDGITRDLIRYQDYLVNTLTDAEGNLTDIGIYFDYSVQLQQRVGVASNVINQQASKVQRPLFYRSDWESTVDMANPNMMNNFYMRVGEGFGVKTERTTVEPSLKTVAALLRRVEVIKAVADLQAFNTTGKELSAAAQANLIGVVKEGGQDFATLDALLGLAAYEEAKAKKQTSFVTHIHASVDGVTNGPILAQAMFGAGTATEDESDVDALNANMARGGISTNDDKSFGDYKSKPGNKDTYEHNISTAINFITAAIAEEINAGNQSLKDVATAVEVFTGRLTKDGGDITSDGRGIIKGPVTQMMYGAGIPKTLSVMAEEFMSQIYGVFKQSAMGVLTSAGDLKYPKETVIAAINVLLEKGKSGATALKMSNNNDLMETSFDDVESVKAIKAAFMQVYKDPITKTIEENFAAFRARTVVFNQTVELIDGVYNAMYDALRQQFIDTMVSRELNKQGTGIPYEPTLISAAVPATATKAAVPAVRKNLPIRDLTEGEEASIRDRLASLLPVMRTLLSIESSDDVNEQYEAGILISKSTEKLSRNLPYSTRVNFKPLMQNGIEVPRSNSVGVYGFEKGHAKPGVRMLPLLTQSTESYISHATQLGRQLGNTHDSVHGGLSTIHDAAEEMNKNTFHALLNYSPMQEAYNSLARTVDGLGDVLRHYATELQKLEGAKGTSKYVTLLKEQEAIATAVNTYLYFYGLRNEVVNTSGTGSPNVLLEMLKTIKSQAAEAESLTLDAMAQWTYLGQYALENMEGFTSSYEVTPEDRNNIAAKRKLVSDVVPPMLLKDARDIRSHLYDLYLARTENAKEMSKINKEAGTNSEDTPTDNMPDIEEDAAFSIGTDGLIKAVTFKTTNIVAINKAANLTPKQLHALKLHEVGIHYGLEKMIGTQAFKDLLGKLRDMKGKSSAVDRAYASVPADTPTHLIDEEALAYMVENYHNSSLVKQILAAIRNWFLKTTGQALPFEEDAYILATASLAVHSDKVRIVEVETLTTTPKKDFVKLAFDSALKAVPEMHKLLDRVVDALGDRAELTGSLALSTTKDVYRHKDEQIHDLDFRYYGNHLELLRDLKEKLPEADLIRAFSVKRSGNFVVTIAMPVGGVRILSVASALHKGSFLVTGTVNNGSPQILAPSQFNAVDFFVTEGETTGRQHSYVGHDGISRVTNMVDADITFAAKFEMGREKDITDALLAKEGNPAFSKTPQTYNTHAIYDTLHKGDISDSFDTHLRTLLTNIVEKLHGVSDSFKQTYMKDTATAAIDVYGQALADGQAPFTFSLNASGILLSEKQSFVAEQVHATILATLDTNSGQNTVVYSELSKLFREAKALLAPKDFFSGDWAKAQPHEVAEATTLYDRIFNNIPANVEGRSNYLAEFAALGLAHEGFSKLLKIPTKRAPAVLLDRTLFGMLKRLLDKALEFFNGKLTSTHAGQNADQKLQALVQRLVDIEVRRHKIRDAERTQLQRVLDSGAKVIRSGQKSAVAKLMESRLFMQNSNVFIAASSGVVHVLAASQVRHFFKGIDVIRNKHFAGMQGITAGFFSEMNGPKAVIQGLLRSVKYFETQRQKIIILTNKFVLNAFDGQGTYLKDFDKRAITKVLLHTGAHTLLSTTFDTHNLASVLNDSVLLDKEIDVFKGKLNKYSVGQKSFFIEQSKSLGYALVTGRFTHEIGLKNAHNIASGFVSPHEATLDAAEIAEATKTIDVLSSLYALSYSSVAAKESIVKILEREHAREDKGNGINVLLLSHKEMEQQSKERLFSGSPVQMAKGYVSEIYNPYTKIKAANAADGKLLMELGYEEGAAVSRDPHDFDPDAKRIYVLKGGGDMPWLSGFFSFKGKQAKGTKAHGANAFNINQDITTDKLTAVRARPASRSGDNFDPTQVKESYMPPLLNDLGQVVNYQYLMHSDTKDQVLERDNRFDIVMGALNGSIYDKENSVVHNRKAVQVLFDDFNKNYEDSPNAYLRVSPKSQEAELRDIYAMLPPETKEAIREIWGKDEMMVRSNNLDISFGYRKRTLSTAFAKEEEDRNFIEQVFVMVVESLLALHGRTYKGMNAAEAERYAKRAAIYVRRSEDVWQALVKEVKDIVVVKMGIQTITNIVSNGLLLKLYGVPTVGGLRDMQIAWVGAQNYALDTERLFNLEAQLAIGAITTGLNEVHREIAELKDSIERNPVRVLIEDGLMPTIVEDNTTAEDIFAYKALVAKKTEKFTNMLHKDVRAIGKQLYMTHDTQSYKNMARITQLSDFVARYALYQHLTTRKENPIAKKFALQEVSDAFINYDVPMHRDLQYIDDIGLMMFTKYFLRIQRVIRGRFKHAPGKVAMLLLAQSYFDWLPAPTDGSILFKFGDNPLATGAFGIVDSIPEIMPINAGLSLFK